MRILLLAAAFFLAGIVSAQTEPDTPPAMTEYPGVFTLSEIKTDDGATGYVWTAPGRESASSGEQQTGPAADAPARYGISVTVIRHDNRTDWSYTAFDRNAPGVTWELGAEVNENGQAVPNPNLLSFNDVYDFIEEPVKDDAGNDVLDEDGNILKTQKQGDFLLRVYSFSLPIEKSDRRPAPAIAVRNNTAGISSDANAATKDGLTFYKLSETSLAFGIAPGPDGGEPPKPDAIITIGQPLPPLLVTILVAFCAGAAFLKARTALRSKTDAR